MKIEELLQNYPTRRIKPFDGMAVTAKVWNMAHEYHRKSQGLHTLFSEGAGILAGLEVIASEPPDTSVYIMPGIAIDPAGQFIVLPQPVAYDVGYEMDGLLYLFLSYGESQPRSENGGVDEGEPLFLQSDFSITARTTWPASPVVELARVTRSERDSHFLDAGNPTLPNPDEIDLRFRREVNAPREVEMAVCYLGQVSDNKMGRGASYLAQTLRHAGSYHVAIQDGAVIGPGIVGNTLVYLVGQGNFELNAGIMNGLRNYVHRGRGTLFIESLDSEAEAAFMKFLNTTSMQPEALPTGHRLLTRPHVFAAPPVGFETQGKPDLLVNEGVIYSTHKYGLLWQGERRGRLASREEIRAATELGVNIITYAEERRRYSGQR